MMTGMGALMERWYEPNFDVDAVLVKVLELVVATVPNAKAPELAVLLRSLAPDSNFAEEEQALRQARNSLSVFLGIDPEDTNWTIDTWTLEKRVAAIFLCIVGWCIDSENLGAESAMEHSEDLLVEVGKTRHEAAGLLSAIVAAP